VGATLSLPALDVPGLLRRFNLHPDKRLGQNFLVDRNALERVIEAAAIAPGDSILEIGPGLGSLTRYLALKAQQVTAVEVDPHLIRILKEVLIPYANVRIIEGDILALNPALVMTAPGYLVVANIPYNITSSLVRHLLEAELKPTRVILTVQREVAERITSPPGKLSLLALSVQVYGKPVIMTHIPAEAFFPVPNVDSAVIRIDLFTQPLIPGPLLPLFFRLAKAGYSQKRKTLRNSLAGGMRWSPAQAAQILQASSIDPMRRAETLHLDEWKKLTETYLGQITK
jgi:16S rRNA (adenine1518-N6/adenine1519-N6)-dimethyltransferase